MGPGEDGDVELQNLCAGGCGQGKWLRIDDDDVVDAVLEHLVNVRARRLTWRETQGVTSTAGRLLVAEPLLGDPNFDRTVVLMVEHTTEGAMGLVLNRPTDLPVETALPAWYGMVSAPPVLHVGGPVEEQSGWCLARLSVGAERPGFLPVVGDVGLLDLEVDPRELTGDLLAARLYAGYSGWGAGQLDDELGRESWIVVDAAPDDPFLTDSDELWSRILLRQGGRLARLSLFPRDLSVN